MDKTTGGTELVGGGYVWRRGNTRYGFDESIIDQTDLYGTFATGSIKHSIAVGTEFSWEKDRRGAFVEQTGATISPRCDTATVSRYYCTSLFNPNPNDPWVNTTTDTSNVPTPIVKGLPSSETQNDANTQSIYGFDSITVVPAVIVNIGLRYDRFQSILTPAISTGLTPAAAGVYPGQGVADRPAVQLPAWPGLQADARDQRLCQLRDRGDAAEQPAGRRARGQCAADDRPRRSRVMR